MFFKSGHDLEDAIFGRHSSGDELVKRFKRKRKDFSVDLMKILGKSKSPYPDTEIGKSLYWLVKKELSRIGVQDTGLVFVSAINTIVDSRHFSDGLFYLPSVGKFPITIDAFNIYPETLRSLEDLWIDDFSGEVYGFNEFQTDLFLYKNGMVEWRRENGEESLPPQFIDLRKFSKKGRPENHFIITPRDVLTVKGRKFFSKKMADYFAKVVGQDDKKVLLSHK